MVCDQGAIGLEFQCGVGANCAVEEVNGSVEYGCECDDVADGVCPDPVCTDDPDCNVCTPNCAGKTCGDNGCGSQCGTCELGESCVAGQCQGCQPDCGGKSCGPNGCGGTCGSCGNDESCNISGQCITDCVPSCGPNQACGNNGCGGSCGSCGSGETCNGGQCEKDCFFETQTYTFDASGLDWTRTNFVSLRVRQKVGSEWSSWKEDILISTTTSLSLSFSGACDPEAEVMRRYSLAGAVQCDGGPDLVTTNNITIPAPTVDGNMCTAPPLP